MYDHQIVQVGDAFLWFSDILSIISQISIPSLKYTLPCILHSGQYQGRWNL
jgi:hypothetical protein